MEVIPLNLSLFFAWSIEKRMCYVKIWFLTRIVAACTSDLKKRVKSQLFGIETLKERYEDINRINFLWRALSRCWLFLGEFTQGSLYTCPVLWRFLVLLLGLPLVVIYNFVMDFNVSLTLCKMCIRSGFMQHLTFCICESCPQLELGLLKFEIY